MADKTYALDFTIHDPKTNTDSVKTVTFTAPEGPQGDRGTGIWAGELSSVRVGSLTVWAVNIGNHPEATTADSVIITSIGLGSGAPEVAVGDVCKVTAVNEQNGNYYLTVGEVIGNVQGPQGEKGDKGETGETGPQGPAGDGFLWCEFDNDPFTKDVGTVNLTSEQFSSLSTCEAIRTTSVSGTRQVKVEWYAVGENVASGSGVVTNARTFVSAPDRGTGGMVALTINLRNNSQTSANYTKAQVSGGASSTGGGTFDLGTITPDAKGKFTLTRDVTDDEIQQIKDATFFKASVNGINLLAQKTIDNYFADENSYIYGFSSVSSADMFLYGALTLPSLGNSLNISGFLSSLAEDKLDKPATPNADAVVYLNSSGSVSTQKMSQNAEGNTMAKRASGGQLRAADPVNAQDVVTKQYAEANFGSQQKTFFDLSGEADYNLYQGVMAGYNWTWNSLNPPALSTVSQIQSSFAYGAQDLEAGKSYLALFGGYGLEGLRASVFTVGSDGTSVTWDAGKRWEIPLGAQIRMPNGAVYLAVAKPTAVNTPIYDCVKPIRGRIPLIQSPTGGTTFSGMRDVDIEFKDLDALSYVVFSDMANSSVTLRFDNWKQGAEANTIAIEFNRNGPGNDRPFPPILAVNPQYFTLNAPVSGTSTFDLKPFTWASRTNPGLMYLRFNGQELNDNMAVSSYLNPIDDARIITFSDGTKKNLGISYRLSWDECGNLSADYLPFLGDLHPGQEGYEATASLMSAPAKARALSRSSEPDMSREKFDKIIKGKKGIFTVKDGMVYNLLTGECLM